MRKFTVSMMLICLLIVSGGLPAQDYHGMKEQLSHPKAVKPSLHEKGIPAIGELPVNPVAVNKAVLDDPVLMITRYDLQTNGSTENRIYLYPDGTAGGVAMLSKTDAFSDRTTGTNYYDGTAWGPQPTAGIESSKAGWPSYAPLGPAGEIVVSHHNTAGLFIMTRATKGTGPWTESILAGPAGAVDISWPRVVTNGPDNMYVHIICLTYTVYQGLTPYALLYYRSLDGGATWDIQHQILEGMTSTDYLGFSADIYNWAQPKGDTLAFVFGDSWMDQCVMKSYNNGDDWEKIIIWPCPYNFWAGGDSTGTFWAPDGTCAAALDKYGNTHVVFGLVGASGDEAGSKYWVPQSGGLVYWNENMPQLPEVLDPDSLYAHGNLIGWVADTNIFNYPIENFAYYYCSLTAQPAICTDDDENVFVVWAGITMNQDPNFYFLRHIFARGSSDNGQSWTTSLLDLNKDILYNWSECVYPSLSWTSDENLYIIFQEDDFAGVSLNSTNPNYQGQTFVDNNDIIFLHPAKTDILIPAAIGNQRPESFRISQNFPNPSTGKTSIQVNLPQPGWLTLEIADMTGKKITEISGGLVTPGNHFIEVTTRDLPAGIYLYTVIFNGEKMTRKMVVQ